jgi:hypothetical protein
MPPRPGLLFRVLSGACLVFLATGCGGEKMVDVVGTATRGGKPIPNLVINFTPEKGERSMGLTDQNGRFTMRCTSGKDGVVAAPSAVWVQLRPAGPKDDADLVKQMAQLKREPGIAEILKKYGTAETTPLKMNFDSNQDIELKLD